MPRLALFTKNRSATSPFLLTQASQPARLTELSCTDVTGFVDIGYRHASSKAEPPFKATKRHIRLLVHPFSVRPRESRSRLPMFIIMATDGVIRGNAPKNENGSTVFNLPSVIPAQKSA